MSDDKPGPEPINQTESYSSCSTALLLFLATVGVGFCIGTVLLLLIGRSLEKGCDNILCKNGHIAAYPVAWLTVFLITFVGWYLLRKWKNRS